MASTLAYYDTGLITAVNMYATGPWYSIKISTINNKKNVKYYHYQITPLCTKQFMEQRHEV